MSPSPIETDQRDRAPDPQPGAGRREIGAFLLLEAGAAAPQPAASLILAGR